jgi:hypothetical protein
MNHSSLTRYWRSTGRLGELVRATARRLSDRAHAAADQRARAVGWEVTENPGWFGLAGRSYRDPRFDAQRHARQQAQARRHGRHD